MPEVKRQVKLVTRQKVLEDRDSGVEGFPLREWSIEIYLVDAAGNDVPANIFDKVLYTLHPSFGDRANQTIKKPPFRIAEEGWGEFDMTIHFTPVGKGAEQKVDHDLNFKKELYETKHTLVFRNPKPELLKALEESGPTENGAGGGGASGVKKKADKKKKERNVDMEKLAEGLQKLSEDDLLAVVGMIHDNKSADTYTKNDVENGEFHVDLYTLPDHLVKSLWDYTMERTAS